MNPNVTRRQFLADAGAVAAGLTAAPVLAAAQQASPGAPRTNIVHIMLDDLRFDAFGFMGHPFVETPHLDALAKDGVVFDNVFVTTSLCSPSRASVLTGTYAHVHGVLDNSTALPQTLPNFAQELQQAGYETAFFGKWHMGGDSDAPQPGFDRWVSFRGQGVYTDPELNVDGARSKHPGYVTDLLTDYADEFLRRPHDKPFCACLWHKAVHAMFEPAPRHKGCYADKQYPHPASMADTPENYEGKPDWVRAQRNTWHGVDGMYDHTVDFDQFARDYAETLRAVDDGVGRIVATLRERNLLDSTLLLFTSDNGFLFGEHGLIDKRCMYEPSIRVPLLAYCPAMLKPGHRKQILLNIDFAPTFLELAGRPIPSAVQGRSFLSVLKDEAAPGRDAFLYEYLWERSFPQTPTVFGIRTDRYKFMRFHGVMDRYEIYDLDQDPDEMHNLLGPYTQGTSPGPLEGVIRESDAPAEVKALCVRLSQRLDELIAETGASPNPNWRKAT